MKQKDLLDYEIARRAYHANLSPRYCKLHQLEQYVDGTQYAGRPHWFNDDKPILERAPHIVEPIVANAIESYSDLILGENHWPNITSKPEENDEPFDPRLGLDEKASQTFDKGIKRIEKQADLQVRMSELLEAAMGQSTAVAVCGVRQGKLFVDTVKAKWCDPEFDPENTLTRLKIQYPYLEQYRDSTRDNNWAVRCMLYRRLIDAKADTTYLPAKASETGEPAEHEWKVDKAKTVEHNFGFVPAHWYPHLKGCAAAAEIDGKAIHRLLLDEIDALNRGLSQRNRAAVYNGDPQIVEIGVDESHNPAARGRKAQTIKPYPDESPAVKAKHEKWQMGGTSGRQDGNVRRKGPGVVWRYPNPDGNTDVKILDLDSKALDALASEADDNRDRISEAMCWVRMDPTTNRGTRGAVNLQSVSGKTLLWLYRKQLSRADKIRADFGEGCLLPVLGILLRITTKVTAENLYLAGAKQLAGIAAKFEQKVAAKAEGEAPTTRWFAPALRLEWPAYFEDTEEDYERVSKRTREDRKANLITLETAVKQLAPIYEIEDVDEYVKKLESERDDNEQRELAKAEAEMNGLKDLAHGEPQAGGKQKAGKPPTAAGGGGKPVAAAKAAGKTSPAVSGGTAGGY
jgi:hypothetical protein